MAETGPWMPIVFAGPSVRCLPVEARTRVDLRPPAKRGDLEGVRSAQRPGAIVLIDGLFGSSMAVTPTECRHVLEDGWVLWGASSIGALRAAELWSVGMVGIGEVYLQFRLDPLPSDADVAVAYAPDSHEELTVSIVQLRAISRELTRRGCARRDVQLMIDVAAEIYWCERTWAKLGEVWRNLGAAIRRAADMAREWAASPGNHPKVQDANLAISSLLTIIDDMGPLGVEVDVIITRLNGLTRVQPWLTTRVL